MAKIVKVGGPQKTVFTMLIGILLLEFGSFTKLQSIWGLAFNQPEQTSGDHQVTGQSQPQPNTNTPGTIFLTQPTSHPTTGGVFM